MAGMKKFGSGCLRIALMAGVIAIVIAFAFLSWPRSGAIQLSSPDHSRDSHGRVSRDVCIPSNRYPGRHRSGWWHASSLGLILGRVFFAKSPRQETSAQAQEVWFP